GSDQMQPLHLTDATKYLHPILLECISFLCGRCECEECADGFDVFPLHLFAAAQKCELLQRRHECETRSAHVQRIRNTNAAAIASQTKANEVVLFTLLK